MQIFAILQPFSQYPWVPTFIIQFGNHSNNTIWQLTILFGNKSLTLLQQRTAQCTITNLDTLMILLPVIILLPTLRILSPTLRILLPTIPSRERFSCPPILAAAPAVVWNWKNFTPNSVGQCRRRRSAV